VSSTVHIRDVNSVSDLATSSFESRSAGIPLDFLPSLVPEANLGA